MIKKLFIILILLSTKLYSQDIGYVTGISNISINSTKYYQPIYGISLSDKFDKLFGWETSFKYYQALNDKITQADYLKFTAYLKTGYLGNKASIYFTEGICYNACIHHSNIENHTNISVLFGVGSSIKLSKRISIDGKLAYDIGITNGYIYKDIAKNYYGVFIITSLRYNLKL